MSGPLQTNDVKYDIRQGADRLGLHPSWWWFSLKICGKNAKFATSIATRAVLALPESTKMVFFYCGNVPEVQ